MSRVRCITLSLVAAVVGLTGCATSNPGAETGPDAFRWYADACRTAATTAGDLYASADSPIMRQIAERALDGLVFAAQKVIENVPLGPEQGAELSELLEPLNNRTPLTDLDEQDTKKFRQKQQVVLHSISEVGEMCRSIFAGFDSTRSPEAP